MDQSIVEFIRNATREQLLELRKMLENKERLVHLIERIDRILKAIE